MPARPVPVLEPPRGFGAFGVRQYIRWQNVTRLVNTTIKYRTTIESMYGVEVRNFVFEYEVIQTGDEWVFDVDYSSDFRAMQRVLPEGGRLFLSNVTMNVFSVDEQWVPPGGRFDYHLLSEPGTMSNVEGGFGFVGAGVEDSLKWIPSEEIRKQIGFNV